MRPALRLLGIIAPVVAMAACTLPTAPEAAPIACQSGKVPNGKCANSDWVNPFGDWVNPFGDDTTKTDTTRNGG